MTPSNNYQDLLKQFNALKTLLTCKEREVEHYHKRIQEFNVERIIKLEAELESQKEMNFILTNELEFLNKTFKSE